MPAQNSNRVLCERTYCHVYNRGIAKAFIFKDQDDYEVFLSYLNQYLSPPSQKNENLKTFTVRGRTFQGAPHPQKNYFEQIELVSYSLKPDHFHLVLYQIEENILQFFIKSLCTRYSIYFNKKYKCTGSLFDGPYKSTKIEDIEGLALLTRYIHRHTNSLNEGPVECRSSYPEYLGTRKTPWIKPGVVLSLFDKSNNKSFKGLPGYRSFIESYEPDSQEVLLLEKISIESPESSKNPNVTSEVKAEKPIKVNTKTKNKVSSYLDLNLISRTSVFATIILVFLFLFNYGYRNVQSSSAYIAPVNPSPTPDVKGVMETPIVETPLKTVIITTTEGITSVNIRKNPTTSSEIIGKAEVGETFEYSSLESDWYSVKLKDGSVGYIYAEYLKETGGSSQ